MTRSNTHAVFIGLNPKVLDRGDDLGILDEFIVVIQLIFAW